MVSTKMRPIPPLEMGSKTYLHNKRASGNSKKLGPKSLSNTYTCQIEENKLVPEAWEW
jgi:hypothetical protein